MKMCLFQFFNVLSLPEKSEKNQLKIVVFFFHSGPLSANFQIHCELVKSSLFPTRVHMAPQQTKSYATFSKSFFILCVMIIQKILCSGEGRKIQFKIHLSTHASDLLWYSYKQRKQVGIPEAYNQLNEQSVVSLPNAFKIPLFLQIYSVSTVCSFLIL